MNITTRDAIRIAQIISRVQEQRLPMIMSALSLADITLDGLEELEAYRRNRHGGANLMDLDGFLKDLAQSIKEDYESYDPADDTYSHAFKSGEFEKLCIELKINPRSARRLLADRGYLQVDSNGNSSIVRREGNRTFRVTVLRLPRDYAVGGEKNDE